MKSNTAELIEDHALTVVPADERRGWVALSWNTAGVVTTLVNLFFGALVSFAAGMKIALLSGLIVTAVGSILGWLVGHVGYKSGTSSSVLARHYGFGRRGSALASLIFGVMIIGFLALENALLYKGILFYFGIHDSLLSQLVVYGLFTVIWILLTAYGFALVTRVSSVTLILFLLLLAILTWQITASAGATPASIMNFSAVLPPGALHAMGADTVVGKFIFSVNVLMGSAGALSLLDADVGRYSRRSIDIGIAAFIGNFVMDFVLVGIGGAVMYAARPTLVEFYVHHLQITHQAAQSMVLQSPDSVAAVFIVFAGIWGTALMFLAQTKAQVINTYSASLSLANLGMVVFGKNPGRLAWIIVANAVGLCMLYGQILGFVNTWINLLGVVTTAFAGLIVADFYIVRRGIPAPLELDSETVDFNWAGLITIVFATAMAIFVLGDIIPFRFVTTLAITLMLYPALTWAFKKLSKGSLNLAAPQPDAQNAACRARLIQTGGLKVDVQV